MKVCVCVKSCGLRGLPADLLCCHNLCTFLQQGTFSPGGAGAACQSCPGEGAGYTTVPYIAATSASSCVCIPGYGMSDTGLCRQCPPNTFSEGISKEDCKVGGIVVRSSVFMLLTKSGALVYSFCSQNLARHVLGSRDKGRSAHTTSKAAAAGTSTCCCFHQTAARWKSCC